MGDTYRWSSGSLHEIPMLVVYDTHYPICKNVIKVWNRAKKGEEGKQQRQRISKVKYKPKQTNEPTT